jgi:hypothetical protein
VARRAAAADLGDAGAHLDPIQPKPQRRHKKTSAAKANTVRGGSGIDSNPSSDLTHSTGSESSRIEEKATRLLASRSEEGGREAAWVGADWIGSQLSSARSLARWLGGGSPGCSRKKRSWGGCCCLRLRGGRERERVTNKYFISFFGW